MAIGGNTSSQIKSHCQYQVLCSKIPVTSVYKVYINFIVFAKIFQLLCLFDCVIYVKMVCNCIVMPVKTLKPAAFVCTCTKSGAYC